MLYFGDKVQQYKGRGRDRGHKAEREREKRSSFYSSARRKEAATGFEL